MANGTSLLGLSVINSQKSFTRSIVHRGTGHSSSRVECCPRFHSSGQHFCFMKLRQPGETTDCVKASSVNMFKNKIDKYLVKAGYT